MSRSVAEFWLPTNTRELVVHRKDWSVARLARQNRLAGKVGFELTFTESESVCPASHDFPLAQCATHERASEWCSGRDLNPCSRIESAACWAGLDDGNQGGALMGIVRCYP
jgi:hypothetical protein